ncbi:MAG: two pore domain potassium channel family protein [Ruminococcus sp.]|nr:two pore domain potassium channel family protein [Ruminococcus sp.]
MVNKRRRYLKAAEILSMFATMLLSARTQGLEVNDPTIYRLMIPVFALFGVSNVFSMWRTDKAQKSERIRFLVEAVLMFAGALTLIFINSAFITMCCTYCFYGAVLLFSRVLSLTITKKIIARTWNIIFIILILLMILIPFFIEEEKLMYMTMLVIPIMILTHCFIRLVMIAMSQIRFDILKRIFIKSMASEVLLGLIILIVSSAMVLPIYEDSIKSFGDGLWYCFAIVTTIGFGDITATTLEGRVISVILGIYGIIVVALITSIIINFYSETKDIKMTDASDEDKENTEKTKETEVENKGE